MNLSRNIGARIELPCSIRFRRSGEGFARGITKELFRESLVIIAFPSVPVARLGYTAQIGIAIELPYWGLFQPRLLQCSAMVAAMRPDGKGLRIHARIVRMSIQDRKQDAAIASESGRMPYGRQSISAAGGPRNLHPVVLRNRPEFTNQGDYPMSFLKKLFHEEDGQDMVEYGLVIALAVLAAGAIMTSFKGNISTGFSQLGSDVTSQIK